MSSSTDLFANIAPSSAASRLSVAVMNRLKAMPSWKMSLTEQLLVILLEQMNNRISILEIARERIELENRRIKMLFYFMGAAMTIMSFVLGALGLNFTQLVSGI